MQNKTTKHLSTVLHPYRKFQFQQNKIDLVNTANDV